MNKQTTMLASIAVVSVVATMLVLSGVITANAATRERSAVTYTVPPVSPASGEAGKIMVQIDSPFGQEVISSFKVFQTDNLMKQSGYYTLRLQGPVVEDKRTLLHWVANDLGNMPDGLAADSIAVGGGKPQKMTKPKEGTTVTKIPLTGKVAVQLLEGTQDMYATQKIRNIEFSGCHIAGYHLGTLVEDEKPYFKDGFQYYEEVVFACTSIRDLKNTSTENIRGVFVQTAINNDNRQITNEKGELIISSREYRQPIVLESKKVEELKNVKKEIVTRLELDKTYYKIGDMAVFKVTFTDVEGNAVDPDTIRAVYDGKMVGLEKQDAGVYTFTTPGLTKDHHQLIVSVDKGGFPTDTTYLSIPTSRIS
ncbi:MAG: hypothetical protein QXU32_02925 [Nitrososphaerales archaeon]